METLTFKSKAFEENGWIPTRCYACGENVSPCSDLGGVTSDAK